MVAFFVRYNIDEVKEILSEYDIPYEKWFNDNGEVELRIDIESLNEDELNFLIDKFGKEIKMYEYLILWY